MDLVVLNTDLIPIKVIDSYESLIWTDRYYRYGDFEIYTPMKDELLDVFKTDYYLQTDNSTHSMIIEEIIIDSDAEEGSHITVSGRSLESILNRRIVWGRINLSGKLQNEIKRLLDENIISPSDTDRKIENFVFKESNDSYIDSIEIHAQYTGDNLYDVITKICEDLGIGFRITINDSLHFSFELYSGTDRSYDQNINPYVVFSPSFDNIVNSNYLESKTSLKTVTLIGGEGEGLARKYASVGGGSGLNRREMFTDARDITSDVGEGQTLSDEEYIARLKHRGNEKLSENTEIISFEGQAETTIMFKYGVDFFDGDIVQIENEYGHKARARVLEMVISDNNRGVLMYPTFKTITEKGA